MKVKKMKDKRPSTIIMHNVLIGVLAVIYPYCVAGMPVIQCKPGY